MTPSELKAKADARGSFFFTRDTMKFFGDTMRNFRLCRDNETDLFILYRARPAKHGLNSPYYWTADGKQVNNYEAYRAQFNAEKVGA